MWRSSINVTGVYLRRIARNAAAMIAITAIAATA